MYNTVSVFVCVALLIACLFSAHSVIVHQHNNEKKKKSVNAKGQWTNYRKYVHVELLIKSLCFYDLIWMLTLFLSFCTSGQLANWPSDQWSGQKKLRLNDFKNFNTILSENVFFLQSPSFRPHINKMVKQTAKLFQMLFILLYCDSKNSIHTKAGVLTDILVICCKTINEIEWKVVHGEKNHCSLILSSIFNSASLWLAAALSLCPSLHLFSFN